MKAKGNGGVVAVPGGQPVAGKEGRKILDALHLAIGEIAVFQASFPSHRHHFLADLQWLVLPPVMLRQYKLVRNTKDDTVGYVSWARASDEVVERMQGGETRLKPSEWKSGDRCVVVQLVCRPQDSDRMLGGIKAEVFGDVPLYVINGDGEDGKAVLKEVTASTPGEGQE